jgi:hypothetical protein
MVVKKTQHLTSATPAGGNDTRMQKLVLESKRNQMVNRWQPVLAKCREVQPNKYGLMAAVLENQHAYMESKKKGGFLTEEATTTGDIADFTRFALPMIRKSYPRLIADNLVGVQPMSSPASLIFYIRYRYAISKGQTVAGTQIMRQNTAQQFARQNGWALDPYYSSQTVKGEDLTINPGGMVVVGTLLHKPVLAGTVVVNVYASDVDNCEDATPCLQVTFDSDGLPEFVIPGDGSDCPTVTVDTTTTGATRFNHETGAVTVTLSAGAFPAGFIARADYEFDLENNPFQPEITLSIDSDSVSAVTRKLKTSWSLEAAQDLKSVHNIDAEGTLTDLMADEMVAEIDREIINDLIIAAAIRATHNFATAAGASVNFTDRNIALLYKVLEVANIIHRTTLRGPANWMVTSADIASKFEQLNDFRGSDALANEGIDIGITSAGTIQGKLKLYKDPLFPNCKILLGFKGNSVLDSGYFYAPYIPLLSTPTVLDPNSFTPNKGIMTRYGKKLIEDGGLYYATVNVTNL